MPYISDGGERESLLSADGRSTQEGWDAPPTVQRFSAGADEELLDSPPPETKNKEAPPAAKPTNRSSLVDDELLQLDDAQSVAMACAGWSQWLLMGRMCRETQRHRDSPRVCGGLQVDCDTSPRRAIHTTVPGHD